MLTRQLKCPALAQININLNSTQNQLSPPAPSQRVQTRIWIAQSDIDGPQARARLRNSTQIRLALPIRVSIGRSPCWPNPVLPQYITPTCPAYIWSPLEHRSSFKAPMSAPGWSKRSIRFYIYTRDQARSSLRLDRRFNVAQVSLLEAARLAGPLIGFGSQLKRSLSMADNAYLNANQLANERPHNRAHLLPRPCSSWCRRHVGGFSWWTRAERWPT